MGRIPYKNFNLPKGMRARKRGKNIYYYLDTGARPRKEIALGSDYAIAVQKWAQLTMHKQPDVITFSYVAEKYFQKIVPSKAPATQKDNQRELKWLLKFFDNPPAPIDYIQPKHIRMYLDWRINQAKTLVTQKGKETKQSPGGVRANRERALFSHIWNFAREYGYTAQQNPCSGVRGFKEKGRDVYITDKLFNKVLQKSDKPTEFALRLAYLTGQRVADVLKMQTTDIEDGFLHLRQNKTQEKIRIVIQGELKNLIDLILIYKKSRQIQSSNLLINDKGQTLSPDALSKGFNLARELAGVDKKLFQFRDLRAKAATDVNEQEDIKKAQTLLGHTSEQMTAHYVRPRLGKKANPVK